MCQLAWVRDTQINAQARGVPGEMSTGISGLSEVDRPPGQVGPVHSAEGLSRAERQKSCADCLQVDPSALLSLRLSSLQTADLGTSAS